MHHKLHMPADDLREPHFSKSRQTGIAAIFGLALAGIVVTLLLLAA